MNRPPLSAPLLPRKIDRKPRPIAPPGIACPAPHAQPLPTATPHPARLPAFSPARPALFFALLLSISALGIDCAQLDETSSTDAGPAAAQAAVLNVSPPAGDISADATFEVTFATPMDASLLLSNVATSQTVVLVAQSNAQVMAAALGHARLTAAEEALLISASATLGDQSLSIALAPTSPLAPGAYALLIASRLKDAAGAKLEGPSEVDYTVAAVPPAPMLLDPLAGSLAPTNLARVRVSFSAGASGALVSLVGQDGIVAAAIAPAGPGEAVIPLCPDAPCAALVAGQSYSLYLAGNPVAGASFTVESCARDSAPTVLTSTFDVRDSTAQLAIQLDWPARVVAQLAPLDSSSDAGTAPALLDAGLADGGDCDGTVCTESVFASCAPSSCSSETSSACSAALAFTGLAPSMRYQALVSLEDDEGHGVSLAPLTLTTLSQLPDASIEEVMASPPLPEPRDEGEYVAIENTGSGTIDLSTLALRGPDGIVRPLLASAPPSPQILQPGGYALAVGASFNAARYAIPPSVPVLRALTQRLLGRGLADASPPAIDLVAVAPSGSDAGTAPELLSNFPGGPFDCPQGESIDRVHPAPSANEPAFACGPDGGTL